MVFDLDFAHPAVFGNRKGTWSLFVAKNRRITFRIGQDEIEIINLDYGDYHQEERRGDPLNISQ